jgi:hypothetical protein
MSHPDPLHNPENELPEDIEDRDVPTLNDTLRFREEIKSAFNNDAEEDLEIEAMKEKDEDWP